MKEIGGFLQVEADLPLLSVSSYRVLRMGSKPVGLQWLRDRGGCFIWAYAAAHIHEANAGWLRRCCTWLAS